CGNEVTPIHGDAGLFRGSRQAVRAFFALCAPAGMADSRENAPSCSKSKLQTNPTLNKPFSLASLENRPPLLSAGPADEGPSSRPLQRVQNHKMRLNAG